jgi:uncharacterized repeat protein (TIGR04052 family)
MSARLLCFTLLPLWNMAASAADKPVTIRFQAQVGDQAFACGRQYANVGTTKSTISGRDFRFYVSEVRLLDAAGKETPVQLDQDGKWQLDDLALLDFENGTGACANGTPEMHRQISGAAPEGKYTGLRFTLGIPFNKNHTDPLAQPSPLNLTALFWVWNAGHKFARLDFTSTGIPRGFLVHLGSTGCTPRETDLTIPTTCKAPNRVDVTFPSFDLSRDTVIADLAALLEDTNVDASQNVVKPGMEGGMRMGAGCMSGPTTRDCAGLFANLGLQFGDKPAGEQRFFRAAKANAQ